MAIMCLSMRKSCVLRIDYARVDIKNFSPLFLKIKQKLANFSKVCSILLLLKSEIQLIYIYFYQFPFFLINKLFKICVFINTQIP